MTARTARAPRVEQPEPAVGDTQSMPIVEIPAARLAYGADVLAIFEAKIDDLIREEQERRQEAQEQEDLQHAKAKEQIDALSDHRIAQFRQAMADIRLNTLRLGPGPAGVHPYADVPELCADPDKTLAAIEAAHEEQDAAERGVA